MPHLVLVRPHWKENSARVPSLLPAKQAGHHDELEWELPHTYRDITSAPFAGDNELFTLQDSLYRHS
jgi:hypothetical protein